MTTVTQTTIEAISDGVTYDLTDEVLHGVLEFGGFGLAKSETFKQQGPNQHGATFLGFRLQPRAMRIVVFGNGSDEAGYYDAREKLAGIFRPEDTPIQIRHSRPPDKVRQIDCYCEAGIDMPTTDRAGMSIKAIVELWAPDPTWYDPEMVSLPFQQVGGGTGMAVPWLFPFTLGASDLDQTVAIDNDELNFWQSEPIIVITGPITDAKVENVTTGKTLDLTGTTIGAGDTYTIDTRYEQKTVLDAAGVNHTSELTDDSDIASFVLTRGVNNIHVTGSSITSDTRLYIQYYPRYTGL